MPDHDLAIPSADDLIDPETLSHAGQAANEAARRHAFDDYRSRKADNTLLRHQGDLARWAEYLADVGVLVLPGETTAQRRTAALQVADRYQTDATAWRGVTFGLVEGFVKWMIRQGDAMSSINARLSTVKVYARLASKAGVIDPQDLALIRAVAGYSQQEGRRIDERRPVTRRGAKKASAVPLTTEQAQALKAQPDTPQGRRDALLMCLLLDHGLRVGEVAALKVSDFDLKAGELRFYRPKVNRQQTHRLTTDTFRAALAWFESGDAPIMADAPVLRASRKGGHLTDAGMTERAITKRVRALGEAVGVVGLSAHDCRHAWATYWARKTSPFQLKEAGGWASYLTVDRYVEAGKIANEGMV